MRTTKLVFLLRSVLEYLRTNKIALHVFVGIMLVLVYPMQTLFSGNQNIYFLWAMENLVPNAFSADPILNSPDPYPLFSWLIGIFPIQFLEVWTICIYVVLNSVYSYSLFGIAHSIGRVYENPRRLLSFTVLFLTIHSTAIWGTFIGIQNNFDLRWIWDSGIAEQGVLRGYLQPSVFGVFLLLSVLRASKKSYSSAILFLAPAAIIHANYLFLGAILTLIYVVLSQFEKKTILSSAILLLLVLPYTHNTINNFLLVDAETKSAINNAVLAGYDSNIHLNPLNWLNPKLYLQLATIILTAFLIGNSKLKPVFLTILLSALGLTGLAYAANSTTLISLNPWRLSVILVPISATVFIAKLTGSRLWKIGQSLVSLGIGIICVATVCFRFFGNGTAEFMSTWETTFFVVSIVAISLGWSLRHKLPSMAVSTIHILACFALTVSGLTDTYIDGNTKEVQDQYVAISNLKEREEPNTIYIIPPSWTSFRLNAKKAVFVDENLVYGPALPDLMNRLEKVQNSIKTSDFSSVLNSIKTGAKIKLVAPSNSNLDDVLSSEQISENYSCYLLRE